MESPDTTTRIIGYRMNNFERRWRFRAAPDRVREFETAYGAGGDWARLFAKTSGYLGTELRKDHERPSFYLLIDHWQSRADWEAFRRAHGAEYEELDRRCQALTTDEEFLGEGDVAI